MKKCNPSPRRKLNGGITFASALVAMSTVCLASDWSVETGLFGVDSNWTPEGVPVAVDANILNGGTAQIVADDFFSVAVLRVGSAIGDGLITQSGGALSANQVILGDTGGTGTLTMTGGSIDGIGGTEMWIGNNGGAGIVNLTDSNLNNNGWIIMARLGGATVGQVTLNGTASLNETGGGNTHIGIGLLSTQDNFVTLNDSASMTTNSDVWVGWAGKGTVTLNDASTMNVANNLVIGKEHGNGLVSANGSSIVTAGGSILVGADPQAGNGTPPLGTLEVNDDAFVSAQKVVHVGFGGMSGVLTINGGTVTANPFPDYVNGRNASVTLGYNGGVEATLNLNGGTLETTGFYKAGGTASIRLNGTVIKAIGMPTGGATFFDGVASSDINIQAGGAKFDTNGNDITIIQDLSGVGGLTKLGEGTLFLFGANAYAGDTVIVEGTLSITSGLLADGSNVGLTAGSIFDLDFVGTDTINALFIDGEAQALGTWGGTGSGAEHISSLFSGTGTLTVTAVPEPTSIGLLALGGAGFLLAAFRRKTRS